MIIPAESRIYNNNDVPPEAGSFEMGGMAMTRKRDGVIDKKIGAFIRMQRVKLGMSSNRSRKSSGSDVPADTEIRERHELGRIEPNSRSMPDTRNLAE